MYSLIVVDDESITRMAISGYLQKTQTDFSVASIFSSAAPAMKYMQENPVDVVITDIRMPNIDGLEFAKFISEHFPKTVILIISGYGEFEYARKAISYGVSTYLLKPIDFDELSAALRSAKQKLDTLYCVNAASEAAENEDIQLVFSDLISGLIRSEPELGRRFEALPLSGSPSEYRGHLLAITIDQNEAAKWNYGRESLSSSLQEAIRSAFPSLLCYHLFRSGPRYFFIVLSTDAIPVLPLDVLENVLFHLIQLNCKVYISSSFRSLYELGTFQKRGSCSEADVKETCPDVQDRVSVENEDIIIQRAISYIRANYANDLTRKDVAQAVFLSPAYFSRFFKEKTGMTFIDYLTKVRMQNAEQLLASNYKIGEIAQKVGYQSHNRFVINFREYHGCTPTEYRIMLLKKETAGDPDGEK